MELSVPAELFHDDTMPVITAGIIFRRGFALNDKNDFREGGNDVSKKKGLRSGCRKFV